MPRLTWAADHSKLWFADRASSAPSGTPIAAARRGPGRGDARRHQPVHQSGRESGCGSARARTTTSVPLSGDHDGAHVELAAVRTLGQRRRLRCRRRAGKPAARAWAGPARRAGRTVPRGHRCALPWRRGRRASASARGRGPRRTLVPPIVEARLRPAEPLRAGDPRPTGRRRCRAGDQPRIGQRNRRAGARRGRETPCPGRDRRTRPRRRHAAGCAAAERAEVLAVGGGDGTVSSAAGVALDAEFRWRSSRRNVQPLRQGHRLRHRHKTVSAIREGSVAYVDPIRLNETTPCINTASIGAYPLFVQTARS